MEIEKDNNLIASQNQNSSENAMLNQNATSQASITGPKPEFTTEKRATTKNNAMMIVLIIFALCFLSYACCFQVVLRPIAVAGYSMQPNINASAKGADGQFYTDTVYYSTDLSNLKYGDVVIVNSNYTSNSHSIIKRIIACPNDTITFKIIPGSLHHNPQVSGLCAYLDVYVNGIKLDELSGSLSYKIKEKMEVELNTSTDIEAYSFYNNYNNSLTLTSEFSYNLGVDEFFIMGDNRNNSTDSRYFGPVNISDIEGKAVLFVAYGENLATVLFEKLFG